MAVVRADERWLKRLAHSIGIERAIEVLREARAEELVRTYGKERLTSSGFATIALSGADRAIVLDYVRKGRNDEPRGPE